jgi:hypothetical protein
MTPVTTTTTTAKTTPFRHRALARRGPFLREPALVVRLSRTRGDFSRGVDARSRGGWGPLPARPREIRAGTFVSARPSRPSSRGTPCPRGTRTRRSRSRGSRTTPRRGTTARYARTRPRSRRRTPREPRDARVSRKRVTAWCFFWSRHRGAQAFDSRRETRGRFFSSTRPPSNAPTRLFRLFRLFRPFDEKKT